MGEWNEREERLPSRMSLMLTMPAGTPAQLAQPHQLPLSANLQLSLRHIGPWSGVSVVKCTRLMMIVILTRVDVGRQARLFLVKEH